jgi:thiamine pyrophosphate-dependent acetolactate synthase large subunit-like protein
MGSSALWTATHHRLPLLCIVANNGGYYNDEVHQATVASHRRRPVANKSIGVRLEAPRPHLGRIAEGLGCAVVGTGRVARRAELDAAVREAVGRVRAGAVVVLDVCVLPEGDGVAVGE